VSRADLTGTLGWLTANHESGSEYGDDWQSSLFAAVGAGWYWNDHLKTEVEFGAGSEATAYRSRTEVIERLPAFESSETAWSRRTAAVSQHYQFFRNAWFHPHVGAGLAVTWERRTDRYEQVIVYDGPTGGRVVRPGRTEGPRTERSVSPFVSTGFKAYLTQRGFFRTDLRVALRDGVEDLVMRFGFGVDF
jgi:hypothetical protein